jgi:adenylate cyclase
MIADRPRLEFGSALMKRFLLELQRRKVLRVASAYVVGGWIILQAAALLEGALNLPQWFDTLILALLAMGLPVAVVMSWLFEFTPDGLRRTVPAGDTGTVKPHLADWVLVVMFVAVIGVTVFQTLDRQTAAPPLGAAASNEGGQPVSDMSIAVLPFVNVSKDAENEPFVIGLNLELIGLLSRMPSLQVTSATSPEVFRAKSMTLPQIARELHVRHILEGSVQRSGNDIAIIAQLIDARTDTHLWTGKFNRKIENVFAVQNEIVYAVASALELTMEFAAAAQNAPTRNPEAHRLYLEARGRSRLNEGRSLADAITLYKRAISLEPRFAEAHAGLAAAYVSEGTLRAGGLEQYAVLARRSADTAIKLKPALGQGYAVLAFLAINELDWEAAHENIEKAVVRDRADPMVRFTLGALQHLTGEFAEARATLAETRRADPLNTQIPLSQLALAFAGADRKQAARLAAEVLQSVNTDRFFGHYYLAYAALAEGDRKTAEHHFLAFMREMDAFPAVVEPVVASLRDPKQRQASVEVLKDMARRDQTLEPELAYFLIGAREDFLDALLVRLTKRQTARVSFYIYFAWRLPAEGEGANPKLKELFRKTGLVSYWKKHGWSEKCRPLGLDDFTCA